MNSVLPAKACSTSGIPFYTITMQIKIELSVMYDEEHSEATHYNQVLVRGLVPNPNSVDKSFIPIR